jgi:hypothetical protein
LMANLMSLQPTMAIMAMRRSIHMGRNGIIFYPSPVQ